MVIKEKKNKLSDKNKLNNWNKIHLLVLVGLILRIFTALISNQIHHSDEIFQYLDKAHSLVFGYGYETWEFRFAIRSWILPAFISILLFALEFLNIDSPVLYIGFIKILFCVISVSIIYTGYIVTKKVASESAGITAAIFLCFWYELIGFSYKPTPEVLATYIFMGALAIALTRERVWSSLLFGLLCAAAVILRLQYSIPVAVLVLYIMFKWQKKNIFCSALIFGICIVMAGYIDHLTWGKFFISYYNNYIFNKVHNVASLFGVKPFYFYFATLTITSAGLFSIVGLLSLKNLRKTWLLLFLTAVVILPHTIIPHKEHRFIFIVIPFFLMLSAIAVTNRNNRSQKISDKRFKWGVLSLFGLISLSGSLNLTPFQSLIYHNSIFYRHAPLDAYLYLHKEKELHSLLNLTDHWSNTGAFYYLHRNIPIYFEDHFQSEESCLPFVSHIICSRDHKQLEGFQLLKRFGSIEIRTQINPPTQYRDLLTDTKKVLQDGIDDKYNAENYKYKTL